MRLRVIGGVLYASAFLVLASPFVAASHRNAAGDWLMRNTCPSLEALSPAGQEAFRQLFWADVFAGGVVGYGGEVSDEAAALRKLLEQDGRSAALQDLLGHASPAGRLYALSGLYVTDAEAFSKAVADLQPSRVARALLPRTRVPTQFGCIRSSAYFDELVLDLRSGTLARDVTGRPQQALSESTP